MHRNSTKEQWEPSTCFSSFWTLQEAVLCPRLELWTKNWHRLEDATGTAVSLVSLTVFLHIALKGRHGADAIFDFNTNSMNPLKLEYDGYYASNRTAGKSAIPRVVRQLEDFLEMTRLDNVLLSTSPISIIFNANIRSCTGSRTPAIVSAIGVTFCLIGSTSLHYTYELLAKNLPSQGNPIRIIRE